MNDKAPIGERPRSFSLGGQVEEVCDRFEAAWKTGRPPPIEDYLAEGPEPGRAALLRALVELDLTYRRRSGERPTRDEYQRRFPAHAAVIETILGAAPSPPDARTHSAADHNLLTGLLALQNNFIDRQALVAAFAAWMTDKSRDLGRILLESGALDAETHALLEALARKQLLLHGGDVEASLAAASVLGSIREDLERLDDQELQTCLTRVHENQGRADPGATVMHAPAAGGSAFAGGRFQILRLHKTGGLGAVYVAHDEELHREVALKEIRGGHAHDPESRARFLQEAEITGRLEHPGIIPVYGLGTYADGRPFYAMRFIKGDNLSDAIARFHGADALGRDPGERALSLRELLGRFVAVCNAMAYAHSRGILHRDLKPSNILLGPYGETLLVDWGLAKPVGRPDVTVRAEEQTLRPHSTGSGTTTLPGDTPGTPAYMSPEQAAGDLDRLGLPSDVYSLGATLYCLVTGKAPFEDRDINLVLNKVRRGEFPPPRAVNRTTEPALEAICLKAMALRPEDRYDTPTALAEDLGRWLAGEPVSARREPLAERMRRWMRGHRTLATSTAAVLVFGLVGLAGFATILAEKNRDLDARNKDLDIQRDVAVNAEQTAREEQAKTSKVLGFLKKKVLAAVRPKDEEGGLGPETTIRAAVDAAELEIENSFADQPMVEASIRETLGESYMYLGEPSRAIRQFDRVLALRRKNLGPVHTDTLVAVSNLAMANLKAGHTDQAIKILKETLELSEFKLGLDDPDTLSCGNNLAQAYQLVGNNDVAIKIHEAVLKVRESKLGPDDPDTVSSRNNLAGANLAAGHAGVAIEMLEAILKHRESKLGFDHHDTLTTRNDLAEAYRAANQLDKSIKLHEVNLKLFESKLGALHPHTLIESMNLGYAYHMGDRNPEAVRLLRATLKTQESKLELGAEHPNTLDTAHKLGHALSGSNPLEAEPLFRRALEGYRKLQGPNGDLTIELNRDLAVVLDRTDRSPEAERLFRVALEAGRKRFGQSDRRIAPTMARLGSNLIKQGNWVAAEAILREELEIRRTAQPDEWTTFNARSLLGESLLGQKKFAAAEPLILSGFEGMRDREAQIPAPVKRRLTDAADRVFRLYEAWNNPQKAEEWRKRLDERARAGK